MNPFYKNFSKILVELKIVFNWMEKVELDKDLMIFKRVTINFISYLELILRIMKKFIRNQLNIKSKGIKF